MKNKKSKKEVKILMNSLKKTILTKRELDVAKLVATGLSNKEASEKLFISEKTVKFHLTNIYKKMYIKSRSQLIVWFFNNKDFI